MAAGSESRKDSASEATNVNGNASGTADKPSAAPTKLKTNKSKLAESIASSRADSPASSQQEDGKDKEAPPPLSPVPDNMQRCKHCKTAVERNMLAAHSKQCDKAKAERLKKKREKSGLPPDAPLEDITPTSTKGDDSKTGKKRKADDTTSAAGDKPPTKKQKKKEEAAAKAAAANGDKSKGTGGAGGKPKGPVDVEKQCGVPLPNGAMCARSLTCKSHAMGAKRAVPGRSAPYDVLLANYQKKNQAKQQRLAMQTAGAAAGAGAGDDADFVDEARGPVDSDEERDAVMAGVARAAPKPLVWKWSGSVASRYKGIRVKEMLAGALRGNSGGGLFSTVPSTLAQGAQGSGGIDGQSRAQGQAGSSNAGIARPGSMSGRKGSASQGITAQ